MPDGGECALELIAYDEPQLLPMPFASSIIEGVPLRARPVQISERWAGQSADGNQSSALALVLPRRDVHLLCPDDRLARWVEVPTALLNRRHLVLVRSESVPAVTSIMSQLAPQSLQPFQRIHKPVGWDVFKFTPDRNQTITGAFAVLSPRGNEVSSMDGGLPISKRKRIYLRRGAPDLIRDLHERAAPIVVDGAEISAHDQARLRLADLGMAVGKHSIAIGGVHYQLRLVDEFADESFEGTLSFTFQAGRDYKGSVAMTATGAVTSAGSRSSGDVTITGAAIIISSFARKLSAVPQPPHIRAGGLHYLLGCPGEVVAAEMQPPTWLQDLGLNPHLVDSGPSLAAIPFTVFWALRVTRAGTTVCAVHADIKPGSQIRSRAVSMELWRRVTPHIRDAVAEPADQGDPQSVSAGQ